MLNRLRLWFRSLVLRRRLEQEMRDEMAEHLERATARFMARGLSAADARREALLEFGNVTYLQEEAREARGGRWLDALIEDSRFALRHFRKRPGTTMTILAVLALGMAINVALFSFVHSYSVQPPPGTDPAEGLVRIRGAQTLWTSALTRTFSYEEFQEYRALTDHFGEVVGWTDDAVALDVGDDEELRALPATATFVTDNYFPVLGVRPAVGSGFPSAESADPAILQVAIIGDAVWDRYFGRSPDVIGATVKVNGIVFTIAGVAPPRFNGVDTDSELMVWLPLPTRHAVLPDAPADAEAFRAVARLRPGVSPRAATSAVEVVAARAASRVEPTIGRPPVGEFDRRDVTADVVPLLAANGDPKFEQDVRLFASAVGVLGLLVLLVTCTNVSALLTGHALARRREIAMRLSLGAGRARVTRQLLTESILLATAAGAVALGIIWTVLRAVVVLVPSIPYQIVMDWRAAAFTFGIALAAGILFGLSPALHATRLAIASALKDSTAMIAAPRARLQRGLVVAQIAFTQPLIVCLAAALLVVLDEYREQRVNEHASQIISLRLSPTAPVPRSVTCGPAEERCESEEDSVWLQQRREEMRRLRHRLA